jgi:DNA end-binding protein Ku
MTQARSIRSATIMFGLLPIPVRLYTSNESVDELKLNLLHVKDKGRLKQQHTCLSCSEVVEDADQVRGFEHTPGNYVLFTAEELDAFKALCTGTLKIEEFIPASSLDPIHVAEGHAFYVGPDRAADGGFAVLMESMQETKRIAIGSYSRDGKERLVALRPYANVMMVHELRYPSEIRSAEGVPVPAVTSTPPQLKIAKQIIERMTLPTFAPERYSDGVFARRRELIQKKIDAGEIIKVAPSAPPTNVVDMIEALKASLDVVPARSTKRIAPVRNRKTRVKAVAKKRKAG